MLQPAVQLQVTSAHLTSEELAPWEVLLEPEPDSEADVSSCARSCTMKSGVSISACKMETHHQPSHYWECSCPCLSLS
jgi:hypothetical protein